MEKSLYQAPEGIEALAGQPDVEIEIVNPEEIHIEMDGLEIDMMHAQDEDWGKNLAEDIPESVLTTLAGDLLGDFEEDVASRKDWIQTYVDGLELLGLKIETRSEPWEGACGVYHPLMAEALVKFQT